MLLRFPFRAKVVAVEHRGKPAFRLQRGLRHVEDAVPYNQGGVTAADRKGAEEGGDLGQKNPSVTKFRGGGKT